MVIVRIKVDYSCACNPNPNPNPCKCTKCQKNKDFPRSSNEPDQCWHKKKTVIKICMIHTVSSGRGSLLQRHITVWKHDQLGFLCDLMQKKKMFFLMQMMEGADTVYTHLRRRGGELYRDVKSHNCIHKQPRENLQVASKSKK